MKLHILKGEEYIQVGYLKGVTIWCEMCQEQADHNATWHLEREMDP